MPVGEGRVTLAIQKICRALAALGTACVHRGPGRRGGVAGGGAGAAGPIALLTSNDGDALNLNQKAWCRKCADGDEGTRWKAFFEYFLTNIS